MHAARDRQRLSDALLKLVHIIFHLCTSSPDGPAAPWVCKAAEHSIKRIKPDLEVEDNELEVEDNELEVEANELEVEDKELGG